MAEPNITIEIVHVQHQPPNSILKNNQQAKQISHIKTLFKYLKRIDQKYYHTPGGYKNKSKGKKWLANQNIIPSLIVSFDSQSLTRTFKGDAKEYK